MPAIVVTARDIRITARQRGYVEEKLEGLQKYFVGLKKLEAVVEQSGEEVEIHLRASVTGGKPLVCSARAKKIYQAVNLACGRAEALLRRFKEKIKSHRVAVTQKAAGGGRLEQVISLAADGEPEIQYRDEVLETTHGA